METLYFIYLFYERHHFINLYFFINGSPISIIYYKLKTVNINHNYRYRLA